MPVTPTCPSCRPSRGGLGARRHDRRGDRRHLPLRQPEEARRLHRALPARLPVRRGLRRGSLAKNGPTYLRWALIEASRHACSHPLYKPGYERMKARLGRNRGGKVARVELARKLAESIWHMLTTGERFAPARSQVAPLVA